MIFLSSNLGPNPSLVWCSITTVAKPILQAGPLWRIRHGDHIRIWGNN